MGKTSIEWTDASWNPIVGCTEVSPGCANCYAARLAASRLAHVPAYQGLATIQTDNKTGGSASRHVRWNGEVRFLSERLTEPQHWKKTRRIFVCDMGDLFHEAVTDEQIKQVWFSMLHAPQHTYQILTKRADRMLQWTKHHYELHGIPPNVWLGVSVENQHFADERIPLLLQTPAAVRFLSAEPLLGPIRLHRAGLGPAAPNDAAGWLHWVIAGGESGPHARPMHPAWARSLRDQCQAAGVPFFFKQWGEFAPLQPTNADHRTFKGVNIGGGELMLRYGKKLSGRLLDGREWNEFPKER